MPKTHPRPVKTTETSFEILNLIREQEGMTLPEVTSELEIAKSTAHRHLKTLEELDILTMNGEEYNIGLKMLDFGLHARRNRKLYSVSKPKIDELSEETGEKVWCITHEHGRSIHLYGSEGKRSVRTRAREGQQGYLHQSAAGKAILSTFSPSHIESIIDEHGLPAKTDRTITDSPELFEELEEISRQGYAFNLEESVPRLNAIGVPITDSTDVAIGAISISGPSNRMKNDLLREELPELLLGATNEIEINLNYAQESDSNISN